MKYKFSPESRYITCRIQSALPIQLQAFIWERIYDLLSQGVELDYLQVFTLMRSNDMVLIVHEQEQPEPYREEHWLVVEESVSQKLEEGKIFVIDDIDHSTMLWGSEY